ncbi:hypothetical protein C8Q78DRAFT_105946 [Trametes maxima]|nr:hypothetical protein C8Q78DRAFT_105946 [Trametes maxima]
MSQMNARRRSTVHDLATLRLHRDGTRVLNSDTNRSSRRAKHAIRDARGNWVAQDAGGLGNVKQRRNVPQPSEDNASESDDADIADDPPSPRTDKGKARAHEELDSEVEHDLNPRARKRRRFDEDFGYLASHSSPALVPPGDSEQPLFHGEEDIPGALPVPSSDLLKCLHYFASTYYTAMGQLYDASREFRKQKKARSAEKSRATHKPRASSSAVLKGSSVHEAPHSSGEEEIVSSDADPTNEDPVENPASGSKVQVAKTARKRGRRQVRPMEKDMYRVFDGSALVALGMLFQEHIARTIETRVPGGWEIEMASVERTERKEAKNARKAKEMRERRHPVKDNLEGREDDEELSPESEGEQQSSEETESDDEIEDASATKNVALKRHSSVAAGGDSGSS